MELTKEQREELLAATKAKKEEKAKALETKQVEEDKKLLEEAKELGLDISKYEKKQEEQPSKIEKEDGNLDIEKLGKVMGNAIATALKDTKEKTIEEKHEDVEIVM